MFKKSLFFIICLYKKFTSCKLAVCGAEFVIYDPDVQHLCCADSLKASAVTARNNEARTLSLIHCRQTA